MQTTHPELIRLTHEEGQLVVRPEDQERFYLDAQLALRACRSLLNAETFLKRFRQEFLGTLWHWCAQHQEKIASCRVTMNGDFLQVFMITKQMRFDVELGKKIAALELCLAGFGWSVSLLQVPKVGPESLEAFVGKQGIEVYANQE
jgi:hypothetical protein